MVSEREFRQYDLLRSLARYCRNGSISLFNLTNRIEGLVNQCEEMPEERRRELLDIWTEFEILNAVSVDGTPLSQADKTTLENTKQRFYQWVEELPEPIVDEIK